MEVMYGKRQFFKTKFDSLDGKTVVAMTTSDDSFQVRSTRGEMVLKGEFSIESEQELQQFAQLISHAWTEHRKLLPRLATNLSGH